MAALILTAAATAITGSLGITGILSSLIIGAATVVGTFIDRLLFTPSTHVQNEGPRLGNTTFMGSSEGTPITRGYGIFKTGGQVIWATRFEEEIVTDTQEVGGKGGGGSTVTTTTYNYYANFAVAICEGEIGNLYRVWTDGKEIIDLTDYTYRLYKGTETQNPDSLIETKEGAGNVPGYRGVAYIVFERMPLEKFGNRIPQLTFEVDRPVLREDDDSVEHLVTAVNLIPGTTEFGYDPDKVIQRYTDSNGKVVSTNVENNHLSNGDTDWNNAMDQMASALPDLDTVCLVVTWFGDDLRIGECTIRPKVENANKRTHPISWSVDGLTRSTAQVITQITFENGNTGPAFGGTPNDASVIRAIQDLKARGYKVMFYPFIIMDIPSDNTLPNPYSDNAATIGQPAFPWRGRITCSPAAGFAGTVDKTATAASQVDNFVNGTWGFRRFILHYANLCDQAGGVDYFCIGTEMVGATTIRSDADTYPFVDELVTLAGDVKAILPSTLIGYAADWSEYHSHRPSDGTGDVYFNMDPLWSSPNIDFIGIDNYLPLSDWRDGITHLDYQAGYKSVYDLDYLKDNIEGGEYYDWFYASAADRSAQIRTPITDGAYGKPWVFRNKDIKNWWLNTHVNRPGGVEGSATSWTPESKQIIFTEFGCPALDKATNQPNVFYDPKSSESQLPYFSSGTRDDMIQRQYIRAMKEYWSDNANNPTSGVYAGPMIHKTDFFYWAYDARPWPSFPLDGNTWADKPNWRFGHWISHRAGTIYVPDLLAKLAEEYGFTNYDFSRSYGSCDGYILDNVMSFRDATDPLMAAFMFDLVESGDKIKAVSKHEMDSVVTLSIDDIADRNDGNEIILVTRAQETELPAKVRMRFMDIDKDYDQAAVEAARETVESTAETVIDMPFVIDFSRAQEVVDSLLYSTWAQREKAEFGVLPEFLYLEPGDVVTLAVYEFSQEIRIDAIRDGADRAITGRTFDRAALVGSPTDDRQTPNIPDGSISAPITIFMDIPLIDDTNIEWQPYVAAYASPWPAGVAIYRSPNDSNYQLNTLVEGPAKMGLSRSVFNSGPEGVWDNANTLDVELYSGTLESLDELDVLAGANAFAIQNSQGYWEIVQFVNATLIGTNQYRLSKLLRGQLGTEWAMEDNLPVDAQVVFLGGALRQVQTNLADIGNSFYYLYGPANKPNTDDLYTKDQLAFEGMGLRPYSPTDVEGVDDGSGNITISWKRRTRIGGDSWNYTDDVPWSETIRKFEVDVLDAMDNVVRTLSVTDATEVVYTATDQATDGISVPFDVIVYQMSEYVGRGTGRRATING